LGFSFLWKNNANSDRLFLLLLLVVSLSFNLYQHFSPVTSGVGSTSAIPLTTIKSLPLVDLDGKNTSFPLQNTSRPTLLYVFSPTCHWCERNIVPMRVLFQDESTHFSLVGLSLSNVGLSAYTRSVSLPFTSYFAPQETATKFGLSFTPETILVDEKGKIVKLWIGAYSGKTKSDIEQYFHLKLPEIAADSIAKESCPSCSVVNRQ